jgi:hypothetical protein
MVVRFLAADRLMVEEEVTYGSSDGIMSGRYRYRYRLRMYFTLTEDGVWTLTPDSPGVPGVYHHRDRDYWCRPAPTIDRSIRAMVTGAVAVVALRQPVARLRAEEIRATREWESASATVERQRTELATAEAAASAAAEAMHAARRALNAAA